MSASDIKSSKRYRKGVDRYDIKLYHIGLDILPRITPKFIQSILWRVLFTLYLWYGKRLRPYLGTPSDRVLMYQLVLDNLKAGSSNEAVLDVGSGDSLVDIELVRRGYKVTALDKDTYALSESVPGRRFCKADILHIPLPDYSFDYIICLCMMEEVAEDALAMKELSRLLKSGGKILLTVPFGAFCHDGVYPTRSELQRLNISELNLCEEAYYAATLREWIRIPTREIDEKLPSLDKTKVIAWLVFHKQNL